MNTDSIHVSTVATAGDVVTLPAAVPGIVATVINDGVEPLQISSPRLSLKAGSEITLKSEFGRWKTV